MVDHLVRDLQLLRKADLIIARIWLAVLLRRSGLIAFAGLIAVFGLGMANVAAFYALQASFDTVWAAALVALCDLVIAGVVLLIATRVGTGPELDLALDIRRMALDSLQADARDLKLSVEAFGHDIKNAKAGISQLVHDPLDLAAQRLLIPGALAILRGLRAKKEQA